jgi:hypothetical protein
MTFVLGILSQSIRNLAKTQDCKKMPADNKLELVAEVDADKANASIKSVSTGLSCMGRAAVHAAKGDPRPRDFQSRSWSLTIW